MRNKLFVLLAVLALTASTLACAFGGEPGVSNVRMATDVSGETVSSVYSPSDDFFVFFDVSAVVTGNVV